jgi:hypothetical protein
MTSRRFWWVALSVFAGLLVVATTTARAAAAALFGATEPHQGGDGHHRIIGKGQVRFDGAGPERWALRFRRERRKVTTLRHRLARMTMHVRTRSLQSASVGHMQGWLCIHAREGAWDAQTGNGYYGGLQMTYGWAGRVSNAAQLSPGQQMAAAEAEAAEHGWAYSWMAGQWPNTFPPCAGYFR